MKILLLSYYFLPGFEGSTSLITIMAELLAKSGNEVWVITRKFEGVNYQSHPNIKLVFVSSTLPFENRMKTSFGETNKFTISAIRAGFRIIKNEKIEIIHSNAIAWLPGSFLSMFSSKPHIILIHDLYSTDPNFWKEWQKQEGNSRLNAFFGQLLEKLMIHSRHSAIHTVSDTSRDDLIKFGAKKPIFVIHNAIPIKEAKTGDTNPYQLVYVGRLVFYKNLQVTIKALKLLKENFPKINLIIIGKGPYCDNLERLVNQNNLQNNVIFKGHVSEEEKNHLISTSQALVLPSLFEGFGLVILEAFMQKKLALVSDVRPLSDIVEHKETGLVIPAYDEKEWAKAIESIIQNPVAASNMGELGRKVLEEKYTLEKMQQKLENMYKEIVNKSTN